jgi:type II secretory pathway component GspD/PulD (secretin)
VPLKYASAQDVARILNDLMDASARATQERGRGSCVLYPPGASWPQPEPPLHFGADARTNSILIPATTEDVSRILELISRLDAHAEIGLAPRGACLR